MWADALALVAAGYGAWTIYAMYAYAHRWWRWPLTVLNLLVYLALAILLAEAVKPAY